VLRTRPPRDSGRNLSPSDLHALGTPPALILSQDQTLHQCWRPTLRREISAGFSTENHLLRVDGHALLAGLLYRERDDSSALAHCASTLSPRSLRLRHTTGYVRSHRPETNSSEPVSEQRVLAPPAAPACQCALSPTDDAPAPPKRFTPSAKTRAARCTGGRSHLEPAETTAPCQRLSRRWQHDCQSFTSQTS
jgi:hypothetical protein